MDNKHWNIMVNNAFQNIGQADLSRTGELGNLSIDQPTIDEMNRAVSGGNGTGSGMVSPTLQDEPAEPLFGTNLREAAGTVKKLLGV